MRIYAALGSDRGDNEERLFECRYPWVLASFAAAKDPFSLGEFRPGLLLDSGAFSVWTQGDRIDLDEYIAWARHVRDTWGAEVDLFNLDVIPGELHRRPSKREQARAVAESADNAEAIRAAGLPVIEVYHRFEPLDALDAILERRRPGERISLGGLVGTIGGTTGKKVFCDAAFARVRDWSGGWDKLVPVHGLGVSGESKIGSRYPWFSVDASTWFTARNFNLHVAAGGGWYKRDPETAPRTTQAMTRLFLARRLDLWLRRAASLTALWDERGVRFA